MTVKLLTEHHLEFLSLKGCCTGSSESTLVKMPYGWNSHVAAHVSNLHMSIICMHSISPTRYKATSYRKVLRPYCRRTNMTTFTVVSTQEPAHGILVFIAYCRFGNFRENFIFANSIKYRHISDVKNSRLRQEFR